MGNKSQYQARNEGMSISSFSSSNRGVNTAHANDISAREFQNHHHDDSGSIAKQMSKNYFLNTKQLLKHLSPGRADKQQVQQKQSAQFDQNISLQKQSVSQCAGTKDTNLIHELSQRQERTRGRSRSTANNALSQGQNVRKKNHSHSNSRSNNHPNQL